MAMAGDLRQEAGREDNSRREAGGTCEQTWYHRKCIWCGALEMAMAVVGDLQQGGGTTAGGRQLGCVSKPGITDRNNP
jgi:hypothetical protein